MYRIGIVAKQLALSADTLRYYEKLGLLKQVYREPSGLRLYSDKDVSRLKFIKRAQRMGFSLEEIGWLLEFREDPQRARPRVREMARRKLEEIEKHITDVTTLRNELTLLINLCESDEEGCPILDGL